MMTYDDTVLADFIHHLWLSNRGMESASMWSWYGPTVYGSKGDYTIIDDHPKNHQKSKPIQFWGKILSCCRPRCKFNCTSILDLWNMPPRFLRALEAAHHISEKLSLQYLTTFSKTSQYLRSDGSFTCQPFIASFDPCDPYMTAVWSPTPMQSYTSWGCPLWDFPADWASPVVRDLRPAPCRSFQQKTRSSLGSRPL